MLTHYFCQLNNQTAIMKKFSLLTFMVILCAYCHAQDRQYIRPAAIGISFIFNDYTTPQKIRNSSLSYVQSNKLGAKLKEMAPGIGVTYFKGLTSHIDFAGTLAGSFVSNALPNNKSASGNSFLLEGDASVNLKMLPDNFLFTPYAAVGIGASKYGGYYGAVFPVGGGIKINLFDEAAIFVNAKYHMPLTSETAGRHFVYGLGIAGVIGKK